MCFFAVSLPTPLSWDTYFTSLMFTKSKSKASSHFWCFHEPLASQLWVTRDSCGSPAKWDAPTRTIYQTVSASSVVAGKPQLRDNPVSWLQEQEEATNNNAPSSPCLSVQLDFFFFLFVFVFTLIMLFPAHLIPRLRRHHLSLLSSVPASSWNTHWSPGGFG